ncbi:ATP-binding cassette domain-containing protein [Actinomadura nitritigenes]|uniref:ATP-binding cassette domain-containing protein n=1 Tax=Actinomadura nitritigenes TaxID=134602 RepID=UPI003D8CD686
MEAASSPQKTPEPLVELRGVGKSYGSTRALRDVDFSIGPGEAVGLIGHNGAGKSTLTRVVLGLTRPETGAVTVDANTGGTGGAHDHGIRAVFQELSLCPALRVFESVPVARPGGAAWGWRRHAQQLVSAQLERVFPGSRISPRARIESLSLAERQMVEIALATLDEERVRLLILDEPTSALGADAARSLFTYLGHRREAGMSYVLITHRLPEILGNTDRITVMRDGTVVGELESATADEDQVIELMGGSTALSEAGPGGPDAPASADRGEKVVDVTGLSTRRLRDVTLQARRGEIIGLAGLDGQGQQDLLAELWRRRHRRKGPARVPMAFVTGDRGAAGVFPLWSLTHNISVGSLGGLCRFGILRPADEKVRAKAWIDRLTIRGGPETPIVDLSGGTQQKVLLARALASDAAVVLLDDPFRGVDVGTKRQAYELLRAEASSGRCLIWFTTENSELEQCDRVYVFRSGEIVTELSGPDINEERVVAASFAIARGEAEEAMAGDRNPAAGKETAE